MYAKILLAGGIGLVSGIACRSFFSIGTPLHVFVVLLALVLMLCYSMYRVRVYLLLGLFLVCLALGSMRLSAAQSSLPQTFLSRIDESHTYEARVVADPDIRETAQRVTLLLEEGGESTRALAVLPLHPKLSYGDTVRVTGALAHPEPFETLGGRVFNYPAFLAKDGIYAMLPRAEVEVLVESVPLSAQGLRALFSLRQMFAEGVSRAIPEPASSLAMGMLIGGKQGLGKELLHAFTLSGLLPIVVLSGYNVMIVAEAVLRSLRRTPRAVSVSIAALTVMVFVLAAGAGASSIRAGIMAGVGLFARATGRTYDALRALMVVFVAMVLWNPHLLLNDPGFQFSFAATLGIILGSGVVSGWLRWMPSTLLREVCATTIAAQAFVLPLLLYETGMLSLVAIPANVLALPLVPLAMLLSFLAGIVGLVLPSVAPLFGLPAYVVLSVVVQIATVAAELPLAAHTIPQFPFLIVIGMYAGLALLVFKYKSTTLSPKAAG
jgi:competence protein ComEC